MKTPLASLLGSALLCTASAGTAADIDVMTQNQYLGADLTPVLAAATADPFDFDSFSAAVVQTLRIIAANRPAERSRALASEIAQRKPDVVGLQEAYKFACTPFLPPTPIPNMGCDDPTFRAAFSDHLQDTVTALHGQYGLAGKVTNINIPALTFKVGEVYVNLAVADRDAILVRKGLRASAVDFPAPACRKSDDGCNFHSSPGTVGGIAIERGFLAVDVKVDRRDYRVFNTHLEQRFLAPTLPTTRLLQIGQAYELLNWAYGTWDGLKKVLIIGDINSAPVDTIGPPYPALLPPPFPPLPTVPPYQVFTSVFTDAWMLRHGHDEGLTCCQDEDLANRHSKLYERIDMIFSLTKPSRVVDMKLLGESMGDKTRPPGHGGLWPSDHAALAARLMFD